MIEKYKFGKMKISGSTYTGDLLIFSKQIIPKWRRISGHLLNFADIQKYTPTTIKRVIVGTGAFGLLKIEPQCLSKLKEKNIIVDTYKTAEAVKVFNKSKDKEKILAAFHLTC